MLGHLRQEIQSSTTGHSSAGLYGFKTMSPEPSGVPGGSRTRNIMVLNHACLPIAPREHKRATICFRTTRRSMGQPIILVRSGRIESLGLKSRRYSQTRLWRIAMELNHAIKVNSLAFYR